MTEHEDWTDTERATLRELARDEAPPAGAEERTVVALRTAGLLRGSGRRPRARLFAAMAAVAAAFVCGMLVPRRPPAAAADARPQFMVLLYGAEADDAGERERQVNEIKTWARGLVKTGHALSGAKLATPEYRLGDGAETSAGLGGYIVLAADGPEQALALAKTCPHLQHGGHILVRPVDPT